MNLVAGVIESHIPTSYAYYHVLDVAAPLDVRIPSLPIVCRDCASPIKLRISQLRSLPCHRDLAGKRTLMFKRHRHDMNSERPRTINFRLFARFRDVSCIQALRFNLPINAAIIQCCTEPRTPRLCNYFAFTRPFNFTFLRPRVEMHICITESATYLGCADISVSGSQSRSWNIRR